MITGSSYTLGYLQVDGRRYVIEIHTLNVGAAKIVQYLAAAGANYDAIMAARVPLINAALADDECYNNLRAIYNAAESGGIAVLTFNHISAADSLIWLRGVFASLTREQAGIVSGWLLANVTNAQMKNLFGGITDAQLTALKTRLTTKYNAWLAIKDIVGE
jgi:hypothetical protein